MIYLFIFILPILLVFEFEELTNINLLILFSMKSYLLNDITEIIYNFQKNTTILEDTQLF